MLIIIQKIKKYAEVSFKFYRNKKGNALLKSVNVNPKNVSVIAELNHYINYKYSVKYSLRITS